MINEDKKRFSLAARARSFRYAFRGIGKLLRTQHNFIIHIAAALLATGLGFWLKISAGEWCLLVLCIGLVFAAEAFNTAIEWLTDMVSPGIHPKAGNIKDVAAAAVLFVSAASALVGILIFVPKLSGYF